MNKTFVFNNTDLANTITIKYFNSEPLIIERFLDKSGKIIKEINTSENEIFTYQYNKKGDLVKISRVRNDKKSDTSLSYLYQQDKIIQKTTTQWRGKVVEYYNDNGLLYRKDG